MRIMTQDRTTIIEVMEVTVTHRRNLREEGYYILGYVHFHKDDGEWKTLGRFDTESEAKAVLLSMSRLVDPYIVRIPESTGNRAVVLDQGDLRILVSILRDIDDSMEVGREYTSLTNSINRGHVKTLNNLFYSLLKDKSPLPSRHSQEKNTRTDLPAPAGEGGLAREGIQISSIMGVRDDGTRSSGTRKEGNNEDRDDGTRKEGNNEDRDDGTRSSGTRKEGNNEDRDDVQGAKLDSPSDTRVSEKDRDRL